MKLHVYILVAAMLFLQAGCENTDLRLATEAGVEAVTALTLSDEQVRELAVRSAEYVDREHTIAPPGSKYAGRLERLVGKYQTADGTTFNYKVYQDDTVNAFAMADGTIRIYSGLMDLLDDGELRFVIGHEMGHVVKEHVRRKMQLAYAASAIRKGIASQEGALGDIARSQLGGFAELLLGSQFSQLEEKIADDYGLNFLRQEGYDPEDAVTALRKLATLGNNHSFLSSHPDPADRAERMQLQIQGKLKPIEEQAEGLFARIVTTLKRWLGAFFGLFKSFLGRVF
jgi:putative metalloprotease